MAAVDFVKHIINSHVDDDNQSIFCPICALFEAVCIIRFPLKLMLFQHEGDYEGQLNLFRHLQTNHLDLVQQATAPQNSFVAAMSAPMGFVPAQPATPPTVTPTSTPATFFTNAINPSTTAFMTPQTQFGTTAANPFATHNNLQRLADAMKAAQQTAPAPADIPVAPVPLTWEEAQPTYMRGTYLMCGFCCCYIALTKLYILQRKT